MVKLEDALFNWLQIRIVAEARPDDQAAKDTMDFFSTILTEDHHLSNIQVLSLDDDLLQIVYEAEDGTAHKKTFSKQLAEQLLYDIEANPKYND